MTSATVSVLEDERLIREGEVAAQAYVAEVKHTRTRIMPMAYGLLAARRKYPADQDFGTWLQASPYAEIPYNDRAALIKIGEREEIDQAPSRFIRDTHLTSPRTIWETIYYSSAVSHDVKPTNQEPLPMQNGPQPSPTPLAPVPAAGQADQNRNPVKSRPSYGVRGQGNLEIKDPSKAELVKLLSVTPEQYIEFFDIYPRNRQTILKAELMKAAKGQGPSAWKKIKAKDLFMLGLAIVQAGKAVDLSNTAAFDARVWLPDVPDAICKYISFEHLLERNRSIDKIKGMNALAVELQQSGVSASDIHTQLTHWWQTGAKRPAPVSKPVSIAEDDSKARIKHEVKFCGQVIWPCESLKHVTYQDLNAGWHLVHHWVGYLEHASPQKPKEIDVQLGHLIWDLKEASSIFGLIEVMLACLSAYNKVNKDKIAADLSNCIPPGLAR
jgi:hypothetical protein